MVIYSNRLLLLHYTHLPFFQKLQLIFLNSRLFIFININKSFIIMNKLNPIIIEKKYKY